MSELKKFKDVNEGTLHPGEVVLIYNYPYQWVLVYRDSYYINDKLKMRFHDVYNRTMTMSAEKLDGKKYCILKCDQHPPVIKDGTDYKFYI